ncbi:DNA repair protein RAD51-like protein 2-like [Oopsacas minuta]|uniref:DNA repair protein RAD51-like protein 2-like n=1 Tax=Oopsacas minuta TaxID=111878 RepID=A0AAV7KEP4_9METZ|nr:DNA repair protein RAD51-like protein 2-like [Oopsacas minuta]
MIGYAGCLIQALCPLYDYGHTLDVLKITGPAGCGKTQLCLQLSIIAALPIESGGLNTNVLYLDSESTFSATRLLEIAANRFPEHLTGENSMNTLSKRILVYTINNYDSLTASLDKIEETLIRGKVGLIVLDSVASVIRAEFHGDDSVKLSTGVSRLAATLKYLADTFRIPVIVTNQITHASVPYQDILHDPTLSEGQESLQATAALGLTWSHSVNIRIILQYWREDVKTFTIAKSPYTANVTYPYTIKREGIVIETDLQGMTVYYVCNTIYLFVFSVVL